MDQRFRWKERLHHSAEFDKVFEEGQRFRTGGLTLWVRLDAPAKSRAPRMGLAISKQYGNAVARNRIKRLLREVFRLHKTQLPAGAELVYAARPLSSTPRYKTVEALVSALWMKAALIQKPLTSPEA